ncbi:MAG: VgrG-related protein [Candidatus Promineifilaceae bacterium]|nr:VgrG-related protein [Candidatus Promineifilaceae bacterium]
MTDPGNIIADVFIKQNGSDLDADVDARLVHVLVDRSLHLPGYFALTFQFDNRDLDDIVSTAVWDLADTVEIKASPAGETAETTIMKGEVTAIEPVFMAGMRGELRVEGYDKMHRLHREKRNATYENVTDSDLASQVAGRHGLSAESDSTSITYDHVYQHNQTDMEFIQERARRIGFFVFVDDATMYFKKADANLGSAGTLTWGVNMMSFRPRLRLNDEIEEVEVTGWDRVAKSPISGTKQANTGSGMEPTASAIGSKSNASSVGNGKVIVADDPVRSVQEAEALALGRMLEHKGGLLEAEGKTHDVVTLQPGLTVTIEGVGAQYGGDYRLTQVTYEWTPGNLTCAFGVHGYRTQTVTELVSPPPRRQRWPGVVAAVVTDTQDPDKVGRVKVKYSWMTEGENSCWAPVVAIGGGGSRGLLAIPHVDDEVLVAFEHGDFNRPYVIGGLYNGTDQPAGSVGGAAGGEEPLIRAWTSELGHEIGMYDNAGGDKKVELKTADGHVIIFDDTNKKVELKTAGGHTITLDDQGKKLTIKSTGGGNVTVDDNQKKMTVAGVTQMEIKSDASLKLESKVIDINGTATVNIKGGIVNIN